MMLTAIDVIWSNLKEISITVIIRMKMNEQTLYDDDDDAEKKSSFNTFTANVKNKKIKSRKVPKFSVKNLNCVRVKKINKLMMKIH